MEDAPAGEKAGKAAGCKVLAVTTTHVVGEWKAAGADWVVPDHRYMEFKRKEGLQGGFEFTFHNLS
jgi:glycerol 3-phosphatase-1